MPAGTAVRYFRPGEEQDKRKRASQQRRRCCPILVQRPAANSTQRAPARKRAVTRHVAKRNKKKHALRAQDTTARLYALDSARFHLLDKSPDVLDVKRYGDGRSRSGRRERTHHGPFSRSFAAPSQHFFCSQLPSSFSYPQFFVLPRSFLSAFFFVFQ